MLQAIDHDAVSCLQALADHAQAFDLGAKLDGAIAHHRIFAQHQYEAIAQVGANRFVSDQGGGVAVAGG